LVAILLLAYIAFLKPQPQRFAKTARYDILVDTATGTLCDARTPRKQAIKNARREIKRIEALPLPPPSFVFLGEKTPLDKAWDHLKSLLYHRFPYCSEL
ncbi:hypothetical protein LCGC14_2837000, partial [marine sediment metagenome]